MRMMAGEEPHEGEVRLGHAVLLGYYAQDMPERLDPQCTVLETAENAASDENRSRVRGMLGAFLFSGDDVDKKVKVLSGGERARLALCCMLLRPLNFLLLDEPTHHLDIQSKDVLKEALKNYDGTFLLVSHDRDFLHDLTSRLLELEDGRIRDHHLDILELIEKRKAMRTADMGASSARPAPPSGGSDAKNAYHERREREKERRRVQNQVKRLEQRLAELEREEKTVQGTVMKGNCPEGAPGRLRSAGGARQAHRRGDDRMGGGGHPLGGHRRGIRHAGPIHKFTRTLYLCRPLRGGADGSSSGS